MPHLGSMVFEEAQRSGFAVLGVEPRHLALLEELMPALKHNDPFDHLILVQAKAEDAILVTRDSKMQGYGVRCLPG